MCTRILQIICGIVLTAQLSGCFFYGGHDDRWHHDHDRAVVVMHD